MESCTKYSRTLLCLTQSRRAEGRGEKFLMFRTHKAGGFHNFRTHHHHESLGMKSKYEKRSFFQIV
ncbi:unnamed protein product [Prunus armeniaca]